jgi:hypothetical protein
MLKIVLLKIAELVINHKHKNNSNPIDFIKYIFLIKYLDIILLTDKIKIIPIGILGDTDE